MEYRQILSNPLHRGCNHFTFPRSNEKEFVSPETCQRSCSTFDFLQFYLSGERLLFFFSCLSALFLAIYLRGDHSPTSVALGMCILLIHHSRCEAGILLFSLNPSSESQDPFSSPAEPQDPASPLSKIFTSLRFYLYLHFCFE